MIATEGLVQQAAVASCGVYTRGKFSGNLKVSCPFQL